MGVDANMLKAKVSEMYPEIAKHHLELEVCFDDTKDAWVVQLAKGEHRLITYVESEDARNCLEGVECVYLSHQIGQFVQNYCLEGSCEV